MLPRRDPVDSKRTFLAYLAKSVRTARVLARAGITGQRNGVVVVCFCTVSGELLASTGVWCFAGRRPLRSPQGEKIQFHFHVCIDNMNHGARLGLAFRFVWFGLVWA